MVRIFNTYGPRMHPRDGRVVSNFIVQALQGPADHHLWRRTADALLLLCRRSHRRLRRADGFAPTHVTGPINIGNPTEFTIRQLAELVIDLTGSRSPLVFEPLPADDPKQRRPDISKAERLLGWGPTIPLRDGLMRTIAYFDELLGRDGAAAQEG